MTSDYCIVGLGEVLWDLFADGPRFGGAPANFACSAAKVGGERTKVFMVSAVGNDRLGRHAIESLAKQHVDTSYVARLEKPTGSVQVDVDTDGQPRYAFAPDVAWDHLAENDFLRELARAADAICFGTLGQRAACSRATIQDFVAASAPKCLRILDINLREPFCSEQVITASLKDANILKLNDEELRTLAEIYSLKGSEPQQLQLLLDQWNLDLVALTRGARGAALLSKDHVCEQEGFDTLVADTVGAGDAFTAALTWGLLEQHELPVIARTACRIAAYVCSQNGANPEIPSDYLEFCQTPRLPRTS